MRSSFAPHCHFQTLLSLLPKYPSFESCVIRLSHSLPFIVAITYWHLLHRHSFQYYFCLNFWWFYIQESETSCIPAPHLTKCPYSDDLVLRPSSSSHPHGDILDFVITNNCKYSRKQIPCWPLPEPSPINFSYLPLEPQIQRILTLPGPIIQGFYHLFTVPTRFPP